MLSEVLSTFILKRRRFSMHLPTFDCLQCVLLCLTTLNIVAMEYKDIGIAE